MPDVFETDFAVMRKAAAADKPAVVQGLLQSCKIFFIVEPSRVYEIIKNKPAQLFGFSRPHVLFRRKINNLCGDNQAVVPPFLFFLPCLSPSFSKIIYDSCFGEFTLNSSPANSCIFLVRLEIS